MRQTIRALDTRMDGLEPNKSRSDVKDDEVSITDARSTSRQPRSFFTGISAIIIITSTLQDSSMQWSIA